MNKFGKLIVPCEYEECTTLSLYGDQSSNTIAIGFRKGNRWYLFDPSDGSSILPRDGFFDYRQGGHNMHYVDMGHNNYIKTTHTLDNLIVYEIDGKKAVFDFKQKRAVVPPIYESISLAFNLLVVGDGKSFGVVDGTGKTIVPMMYDKIEVRPNYIKVSKGDDFGLYDREGNIKAPLGSKKEKNDEFDLISYEGKYG